MSAVVKLLLLQSLTHLSSDKATSSCSVRNWVAYQSAVLLSCVSSDVHWLYTAAMKVVVPGVPATAAAAGL